VKCVDESAEVIMSDRNDIEASERSFRMKSAQSQTQTAIMESVCAALSFGGRRELQDTSHGGAFKYCYSKQHIIFHVNNVFYTFSTFPDYYNIVPRHTT